MGISVTQLLIVLVIVIVLFGTKRLRNMGGDLGGAIKGFRSALKEGAGDNKIAEDDGNIIESETTEKQETSEK